MKDQNIKLRNLRRLVSETASVPIFFPHFIFGFCCLKWSSKDTKSERGNNRVYVLMLSTEFDLCV